MNAFRNFIDRLLEKLFNYKCKLCGKTVTLPVGNSEIGTEAIAVGLCLNCMSWIRLEY